MTNRFCLSRASKLKSAYKELRNSNIVVFPSSRKLRDYKNAIAPQSVFGKQIIDGFNKVEIMSILKYMFFLIDEMKTK